MRLFGFPPSCNPSDIERWLASLAKRLMVLPAICEASLHSQGAQYSLIKEHTLNQSKGPDTIQGYVP